MGISALFPPEFKKGVLFRMEKAQSQGGVLYVLAAKELSQATVQNNPVSSSSRFDIFSLEQIDSIFPVAKEPWIDVFGVQGVFPAYKPKMQVASNNSEPTKTRAPKTAPSNNTNTDGDTNKTTPKSMRRNPRRGIDSPSVLANSSGGSETHAGILDDTLGLSSGGGDKALGSDMPSPALKSAASALPKTESGKYTFLGIGKEVHINNCNRTAFDGLLFGSALLVHGFLVQLDAEIFLLGRVFKNQNNTVCLGVISLEGMPKVCQLKSETRIGYPDPTKLQGLEEKNLPEQWLAWEKENSKPSVPSTKKKNLPGRRGSSPVAPLKIASGSSQENSSSEEAPPKQKTKNTPNPKKQKQKKTEKSKKTPKQKKQQKTEKPKKDKKKKDSSEESTRSYEEESSNLEQSEDEEDQREDHQRGKKDKKRGRGGKNLDEGKKRKREETDLDDKQEIKRLRAKLEAMESAQKAKEEEVALQMKVDGMVAAALAKAEKSEKSKEEGGPEGLSNMLQMAAMVGMMNMGNMGMNPMMMPLVQKMFNQNNSNNK